jgi:hypothetical protein
MMRPRLGHETLSEASTFPMSTFFREGISGDFSHKKERPPRHLWRNMGGLFLVPTMLNKILPVVSEP